MTDRAGNAALVGPIVLTRGMVPKFPATSLEAGKFGQSARRKAWLWTANAAAVSTDFQLFIGSGTSRGEPVIRMLTAFVDVLISFWEGHSIALTVVGPQADVEALCSAVPGTSQLQLSVLTFESLGCQDLTSADGEAQLRLAAATQSKSHLICQFELGAFPIKPFGVRDLIDLSLQQAAASARALLVKAGLVAGRPAAGFKSVLTPLPPAGSVRLLFGPPSGVWLTEKEKSLSDDRQLTALAVVECGDGVVLPLSAQDIVERRSLGWVRQPWLDKNSAPFVAIADWQDVDVETIVSHIYAAIHR